MEVGKEVAARCEALVVALSVALEAGLPKGCITELGEIVLGEYFNAFREAIMGEPPVRVAPMRVTLLKQGAAFTLANSKPHLYPQEEEPLTSGAL